MSSLHRKCNNGEVMKMELWWTIAYGRTFFYCPHSSRRVLCSLWTTSRLLLRPLGKDSTNSLFGVIIFLSFVLLLVDWANHKILNGMEEHGLKLKVSLICNILLRPLVDQCQDRMECIEKKPSLKVIYGAWLLVAIIFVGAYRGNLMNKLLTNDTSDWHIKSFNDLVAMDPNTYISVFHTMGKRDGHVQDISRILLTELVRTSKAQNVRKKALNIIHEKLESDRLTLLKMFSEVDTFHRLTSTIYFIEEESLHWSLELLITTTLGYFPFGVTNDSIVSSQYWGIRRHPMERSVAKNLKWIVETGVVQQVWKLYNLLLSFHGKMSVLSKFSVNRSSTDERILKWIRSMGKTHWAKRNKKIEMKNQVVPNILRLRHLSITLILLDFGSLLSLLVLVLECLHRRIFNFRNII